MEDQMDWCQWGSWPASETLCYWILPDPIPNLIGSSGTPFAASLSGSFPSSPSFHRCPSCSFRPQ